MTAVGKTTAGFNVLGPLEVWHGDAPVPVPAGRSRLLLAILLLRRSATNTPRPARSWRSPDP